MVGRWVAIHCLKNAKWVGELHQGQASMLEFCLTSSQRAEPRSSFTLRLHRNRKMENPLTFEPSHTCIAPMPIGHIGLMNSPIVKAIPIHTIPMRSNLSLTR
jgi:hypothetical protein